jgi:hypothetical protein
MPEGAFEFWFMANLNTFVEIFLAWRGRCGWFCFQGYQQSLLPSYCVVVLIIDGSAYLFYVNHVVSNI